LTMSAVGYHVDVLEGRVPPPEPARRPPPNLLHPPDHRNLVVARSVDEAIRTLKDNEDCDELDFAYNVALAGREAYALLLVTADDIDEGFLEDRLPLHADLPEMQAKSAAVEKKELVRALDKLQEPAEEVFGALKKNRTLHTLRVDCKGLADRALGALCDSLEKHPALRVLDLNSNCVAPSAARRLGEAAALCGLSELWLDHNFLGNRGVVQLAKVMEGRVQMAVLSLSGNRVGPAFPEELLWLLCTRPAESGEGMTTQGTFEPSPIRMLRLDRNPLADVPPRLTSLADFELSVTACSAPHHPARHGIGLCAAQLNMTVGSRISVRSNTRLQRWPPKAGLPCFLCCAKSFWPTRPT
jgi:hypothetical protein